MARLRLRIRIRIRSPVHLYVCPSFSCIWQRLGDIWRLTRTSKTLTLLALVVAVMAKTLPTPSRAPASWWWCCATQKCLGSNCRSHVELRFAWEWGRQTGLVYWICAWLGLGLGGAGVLVSASESMTAASDSSIPLFLSPLSLSLSRSRLPATASDKCSACPFFSLRATSWLESLGLGSLYQSAQHIERQRQDFCNLRSCYVTFQ